MNSDQLKKLEKLNQDLIDEAFDLRARRRKVAEDLDSARVTDNAAKKLSKMDQSERDAIVQLIGSGAIPPGEAVGQPTS